MVLFLSGWQDSNLRPPRPKRGAITGLRYTPKKVINFAGANLVFFMENESDSNFLFYSTIDKRF